MDSFMEYVYSLPEPLSSEEQDRLLKIFYATRNDEVRELLIKHNLRLVASCVMKYNGVYRDLDDLMQIGSIELMNIIDNKFDINKGVKLSTFAVNGIKTKLHNEILKSKTSRDAMYRPHVDIITREFIDEENSDYSDMSILNEVLVDEENFVEDITLKDTIEQFLKQLDDTDYTIAVNCFGLNGGKKINQKEVAKLAGLTEAGVSYRLKIITNKLRKYILSDGYEDVEDIERKSAKMFVDRTDNDRQREVIAHFAGIYGKEKLTGQEISEKFGLGKDYVKTLVRNLRKRGDLQKREFEVKISDVQAYINCCPNEEERMLLENFYGLNGRPALNRNQLAIKFKTTYYTINNKLQRLNKKIVNLAESGFMGITLKQADKFYDMLSTDMEKVVLACSYGLRGEEFLTQEKIAERLKIDQSAVSRIKTRLDKQMKEYFKEEMKEQ